MLRIRNVAALGFALTLGSALALTTACKKDDGGGAGGAAAAAASDDLSLLPVDSEVVLGLNWQQLQSSSLWKQFVEPKMMQGDALKKLTDFKEKCGFDPMTSLKSMSFGIKNIDSGTPDATVVAHGVDKAKFWPCVDKFKDPAQNDGATMTKDGDVLIVKKGSDTTVVTFVNDSTLIALIGPAATKDAVLAAAKGGSALKTSPAFTEMFSKIKTGDTVWGFVNGNGKLLDKMAAIGAKPKAIFGSINVTDGFAADVRFRMESADAANSLATMMKAQTAQAAQMVDKVDVAADGSDVKFTLVMSKEKLDALIKQFGGMLGGMGGM